MNIFKGLFDIINKFVFGPVLKVFMDITGNNFALSIFLFTLLINIILIPLSVKGQKAMVQQTRLKPKLDELKSKYGSDKQKYSQEMQKLYRDENVSMGGGCLPMIIRLLLVMSVYYLVVAPLTYISHLSSDVINNVAAVLGEKVPSSLQKELLIVQAVKSGSVTDTSVVDATNSINFSFFGLDLTKTPHFTLNFGSLTSAEAALWIIPFLAFGAAMLSSILSLIMQKRINPDAPNMAGMMLTMPLMSLFIAFNAPAALGFYWACSSLIAGIIQTGVQQFYGPYKMIAKESAKELIKEYEKEKKHLNGKEVTKE